MVKAFAAGERLSVSTPEKLSTDDFVNKVKGLEPDIIVIASYGKLVPSSVFKLAKVAALNVHPSLLPQYRGASPIQSAILEGEQKTGVSIAEITNQLDAGNVFGQTETEIGPDENAAELSQRLAELGGKLLLDVIGKIEHQTASKTPQDDARHTYAKKLERNSGLIHWHCSAREIHNQVRAFYPWPSAFTTFRGKRLKILRTELCSVRPRNDGSVVPGMIVVKKSAKTVCVQTQDGVLELLRVQLEGKREMGGFEFALGQRLKTGDRFENL